MEGKLQQVEGEEQKLEEEEEEDHLQWPSTEAKPADVHSGGSWRMSSQGTRLSNWSMFFKGLLLLLLLIHSQVASLISDLISLALSDLIIFVC